MLFLFFVCCNNTYIKVVNIPYVTLFCQIYHESLSKTTLWPFKVRSSLILSEWSSGADLGLILPGFLKACRGFIGKLPQEFFGILNNFLMSPFPCFWVIGLGVGDLMPEKWKKSRPNHFTDFSLESFFKKCIYYEKSDFRKTVETALDPRLVIALPLYQKSPNKG